MVVFPSYGLLNFTTFEGNDFSSIPFTIFQLFRYHVGLANNTYVLPCRLLEVVYLYHNFLVNVLRELMEDAPLQI